MSETCLPFQPILERTGEREPKWSKNGTDENTPRKALSSKAWTEEEAAKVSPKLTVVMIIFLLPVLMSILMGPAMIRVFNTFTQ